jgi:hypothetical protein
MELQQYLINGGTLDELSEKYRIAHRRHGEFSNLILFHYDIGCDFSLPMHHEARGVILDEDNNWECTSRSFDKFFNSGESRAATIDWSTARVQEKADGSLLSLFQYNNKWHIATTGTPDAQCAVGDWKITFSELFITTMESHNLWPLPKIEPGITLLFELMSPYNRVVVPHERSHVVFLGAREAATGAWLDSYLPEFLAFPRVREFPLRSIEEVLVALEQLDGLHQEGFVVVDGKNDRIKIKHPKYVTLHLAGTGTTLRSLVTIAMKGETDEAIAYFPHIQGALDRIKDKIDKSASEIEIVYKKILQGNPDRRTFAMRAKEFPFSGILFSMLDSGKSAANIISTMRVDAVVNLFELRKVWIEDGE